MSDHDEIEEVIPLKDGNPLNISLSLSEEQLLERASEPEDDELSDDDDMTDDDNDLFGGDPDLFDDDDLADDLDDGIEDGIDEGVYADLDDIEW